MSEVKKRLYPVKMLSSSLLRALSLAEGHQFGVVIATLFPSHRRALNNRSIAPFANAQIQKSHHSHPNIPPLHQKKCKPPFPSTCRINNGKASQPPSPISSPPTSACQKTPRTSPHAPIVPMAPRTSIHTLHSDKHPNFQRSDISPPTCFYRFHTLFILRRMDPPSCLVRIPPKCEMSIVPIQGFPLKQFLNHP
jgi:hypothetical protein